MVICEPVAGAQNFQPRLVVHEVAGCHLLKMKSEDSQPSSQSHYQETADAPQSTADLTAFVQNLLQQMQTRFQTMSDSIITKIDEMGNRIDDLEKSIGDLIKEVGVEPSPLQTSQGTSDSTKNGLTSS